MIAALDIRPVRAGVLRRSVSRAAALRDAGPLVYLPRHAYVAARCQEVHAMLNDSQTFCSRAASV